MRPSTTPGPLSLLLKIVSGLLLLQLLTTCASAQPFRPFESIASNDPRRLPARHALRSLHKRAQGGDVPGVDEILAQVQAWGVVGSVPSVFYTEYPLTLSEARTWASCYWPGEPSPPSKGSYKFAIWHRLVDKTYMRQTSLAIQAEKPADVSVEDNEFYSDLFLKHLAQAFAEASSGDVYLAVADSVVPDDRSWDANKAWGGKLCPRTSCCSPVEGRQC